jgi:hypothetical protein
MAQVELVSLDAHSKQWPSTHTVVSVLRTGCTIMLGMTVEAARVDWA